MAIKQIILLLTTFSFIIFQKASTILQNCLIMQMKIELYVKKRVKK
ncbi:hypothetical protein UNSWDHB_1768 [Dehalobacter sp. UNSWDHB]|nr:hypothetical protein UNSWDHB_1768 [Dehalobacter sp. UNSWDHB]